MKIGDKFAFVCSAYFSFEFFYNLKSSSRIFYNLPYRNEYQKRWSEFLSLKFKDFRVMQSFFYKTLSRNYIYFKEGQNTNKFFRHGLDQKQN